MKPQKKHNDLGFEIEDPSMDASKDALQNQPQNKAPASPQDEKSLEKPLSGWEKFKSWAKEHPIAATALIGAGFFSGGGLITVATLGALGAAGLPAMVGGGLAIAGAAIAGAGYAIYKGCEALYNLGKKKNQQRQIKKEYEKNQKIIDKVLGQTKGKEELLGKKGEGSSVDTGPKYGTAETTRSNPNINYQMKTPAPHRKPVQGVSNNVSKV